MTRTAGTVPWGRLSRFMSMGALATALVACGGSGGSTNSSSSSSSGNAGLRGDPNVVVVDAAQRTSGAKNAKVDLIGTITTAGQTIDVTGRGAVDFADKTSLLNATLPTTGQIEERSVDGVTYLKVPAQAAAQFGGKPWLKIDPRTIGASGGQNPFASLESSNPLQIQTTLLGAGDVTKVTDEVVRGVKTVHYRADVDVTKATDAAKLSPEQKQQLQQALGGRTTVPEDIWLDEQGLLRRVGIDVGATAPNTGTSSNPPTAAKLKVQMEFYDYGQAGAAVTVPPDDQTTDLGQLFGQLSQLGSGISG
ncbi:MAG: hypothetical protein QOG60_1907 [Frankiaceae bacterium]|nr:hypothetical protein [Frankiaceae bacterium]